MIDAKDLLKANRLTVNAKDEIIDKLLYDDDIRNFIIKNNLSHDEVVDGINAFLEYKRDSYINKEGERESRTVPGFRLTLDFENRRVKILYVRIKPLPKTYGKLKTIGLATDTSSVSFEDFQLSSEEREEINKYARSFSSNFHTKNQIKGLYICGKFRTGKTYLATAIANEIATKGYSVIEVYYPELSSMLKSSIGDDSTVSFKDIVEELKLCDLLVLDDFGGESPNPFIRDEALGVILNYRMEKNKPVIFTSNIEVNSLADISLRKDGSEGEKIKALRIVERIKEITEEFLMTEKYNNKIDIENLY